MKLDQFGKLRELYGVWREVEFQLGKNNNYEKIIKLLYNQKNREINDYLGVCQ